MSFGSAHKAVHLLHLRAKRTHAMHELRPTDHAARLRYCNWVKAFACNNIRVLNITFFTYEAWFHLSGYINGQNYRLWSSENPHAYHESQLHAVKTGVWCAVSRCRTTDPILFADTVTAERYQDILMQFVALFEVNDRNAWFRQDGATCHTA
jgi:hypothetical protein